ncbi:hypothetical protein [Arthrobacter sp. SO5]|uniref:hypothetical protein n=1 Tax=Arthrobacter sp. SO5 TaxID=1897055 RepID=UPI001E505435|nr:hypothetical protein [Arthrobacter sp. SO5]
MTFFNILPKASGQEWHRRWPGLCVGDDLAEEMPGGCPGINAGIALANAVIIVRRRRRPLGGERGAANRLAPRAGGLIHHADA